MPSCVRATQHTKPLNDPGSPSSSAAHAVEVLHRRRVIFIYLG